MANTHPTRQKPMSQLCSPKSKLDRAMRKVDETNMENTIEKRPARSMSTQPFRHPFWYQKTMKNVTFWTQMGSFSLQIGRPGPFWPPSWPLGLQVGVFLPIFPCYFAMLFCMPFEWVLGASCFFPSLVSLYIYIYIYIYHGFSIYFFMF